MELVAPAGNYDKLYYAYTYGADAAYIGLKNFSLRVKADNFHQQEYERIIRLKEQYPTKKLFCALNITFHNRDIDKFISELDYFRCYPIDSFIIQDIGMVNLIKKYFPQAALHLSTQANCINREAVKLYHQLGFKRVVLGREASLAEIREIKDAVPEMELEAFGHGAMCIAYSGRCLLSSYLTGRSANGGACSHSCRWDYNLLSSQPLSSQASNQGNLLRSPAKSIQQEAAVNFLGGPVVDKDLAQSGTLVLEEKKRPGEYFPVFEGEDFTAILSSKDLCMIDHLEDMKNAGVDSLKVEGRMKSVYYVALVTRAYRKAIDAMEGRISQKEAEPFIQELYNTSHRAFGTGFYYGSDDANETTSGATTSPYDLCAAVGEQVDTQQVLRRAAETLSKRQQELEAMHPAARAAREADYAAHPEKCPPIVTCKEGWHFYRYDSLNKISAASAGDQSQQATELQLIAPDTVALSATGTDYQLVNPETAELMDWVCHGHPCLIYTHLPLSAGMLVRCRV